VRAVWTLHHNHYIERNSPPPPPLLRPELNEECGSVPPRLLAPHIYWWKNTREVSKMLCNNRGSATNKRDGGEGKEGSKGGV
jgi:hypothetical protein